MWRLKRSPPAGESAGHSQAEAPPHPSLSPVGGGGKLTNPFCSLSPPGGGWGEGATKILPPDRPAQRTRRPPPGGAARGGDTRVRRRAASRLRNRGVACGRG